MISRAAAFRLASSLFFAWLIGQPSLGLDFLQSSYKFFGDGILQPFRAEFTYTVAINLVGSGETIDLGDVLDIQSPPELYGTFRGFTVDFTDTPFPQEWGGEPSNIHCGTDPTVEICASPTIFCAVNFFGQCNSIGRQYMGNDMFLCAFGRVPMQGDGSQQMPNGQFCIPPGPGDLVQSHFFIGVTDNNSSGSLLPVTGLKYLDYVLLKSMPGDLAIPVPTAVLYDRDGNLKYISGLTCLVNGRVMTAPFCGLTPP